MRCEDVREGERSWMAQGPGSASASASRGLVASRSVGKLSLRI